jgi:hypothetical protein
MGAGGDIEKDHFVGALIVIAEREFDGVADVAEFARLGFAKLNAACYVSIVDIKTRDDTFCNHGIIKSRFMAEGKSFRAVKDFLNRGGMNAVW